ncbi:MAG: hypothetical protein ACFCVK_23880 [Acidimicrobiales bacterium]
MGDILLRSLVASVVLTVVLNVAVRLFASSRRNREPHGGGPDGVGRGAGPGAAGPGAAGPTRTPGRSELPTWWPSGADDRHGGGGRSRVEIFFPWKAMLIGSIALTVVVNVVAVLLS